jgi:nitrate/TMAO reductase-like tetraheme cytochrome c subunit
MGIITFIILPVFLLLGLAVAGFGVWREYRRKKKGFPPEEQLLKIDLNHPEDRRAVFYIGSLSVALLLLTAFGSFKAYEYTDSDAFCGTICHTVMEPEYTAYRHSPHARVGCVKCHIGPGAGWFVRSKLSGAYQVYSTIFHKYSRPIPTPIENLRPAQETCEQCHWPRHFYNAMSVSKSYYLSDEHTTHGTLDLLVHVGGGNEATGSASGIHFKMNIANTIVYAATDARRQVIPWVKVTSREGKTHTYRSTETTLSEEALAALEHRKMDCIDCHNRPSHGYAPPAQSIDQCLSAGSIDTALPNVKTVAMQALDKMYATSESAKDSIKLTVADYYKTAYPLVASSMQPQILECITALQRIYRENAFPAMAASWKAYPNNIGHHYSAGCFRCHDGKHVDEGGKVLSKDCTLCHTMVMQQHGAEEQRVSLAGLEFRHPVDIGDSWKESACSDCHGPQ